MENGPVIIRALSNKLALELVQKLEVQQVCNKVRPGLVIEIPEKALELEAAPSKACISCVQEGCIMLVQPVGKSIQGERVVCQRDIYSSRVGSCVHMPRPSI